MTFIGAKSASAIAAFSLVQRLQDQFRQRLHRPADSGRFEPILWFRDEGRHGGGTRVTYRGSAFNRASLNVSQVHYDDLPDRALASASALSCIVHPAHPRSPSIHLHISWTEMRKSGGYWRIMADLNPAIADENDRHAFEDALKKGSGSLYAQGKILGEQYFMIPVLKRHRGVAHFYLEQYRSADAAADLHLAHQFGAGMIEVYGAILDAKQNSLSQPTAEEIEKQRDYHTLYLFQVLTLDRGTTSGLLVHDQNDLGILGSLPAVVNRRLLESWMPLMPVPQEKLLSMIISVIPLDGRIEDKEKLALCKVMREHYATHPEALELQAKADIVPPTVKNHATL